VAGPGGLQCGSECKKLTGHGVPWQGIGHQHRGDSSGWHTPGNRTGADGRGKSRHGQLGGCAGGGGAKSQQKDGDTPYHAVPARGRASL